jgi:hypothetical protein
MDSPHRFFNKCRNASPVDAKPNTGGYKAPLIEALRHREHFSNRAVMRT